jgi:hypothetical protein
MSGNSSQSAGGATAQSANPFFEIWTEYFNQTETQSRAMIEGMKALGDPQKLQQRWLEALAASFDSFMRSPAFLEAMRQNLKMMTDMKKLQDQVIEDTARHIGVPLASDIHGLFERLNGVEQSILSRLQAIETRLETTETKRRGGTPQQG